MVACGTAALLLAVRRGEKGWVWVSSVGLTGLIGAAFNGASFLIFNQDFSSLTVAFVIAATSYTVGICAMR